MIFPATEQTAESDWEEIKDAKEMLDGPEATSMIDTSDKDKQEEDQPSSAFAGSLCESEEEANQRAIAALTAEEEEAN